jgi:hypothetical protein
LSALVRLSRNCPAHNGREPGIVCVALGTAGIRCWTGAAWPLRCTHRQTGLRSRWRGAWSYRNRTVSIRADAKEDQDDGVNWQNMIHVVASPVTSAASGTAAVRRLSDGGWMMTYEFGGPTHRWIVHYRLSYDGWNWRLARLRRNTRRARHADRKSRPTGLRLRWWGSGRCLTSTISHLFCLCFRPVGI